MSPRVGIFNTVGTNTGDEAIFAVLLGAIRERWPEASVHTVSRFPARVAQRYELKRVELLHKANLFGWTRLVVDSDVVLVGGGTLIQDHLGFGLGRGMLWYLATVAALSRLAGRRLATAAIGADDLHSEGAVKTARWMLKQADLLTVRDEPSARVIAGTGIDRPLVVGADPAFLLPRYGGCPDKAIVDSYGTQPYAAVSVLNENLRSDYYIPTLARACDYLAEQGLRVLFVPMDSHPNEDVAASHRVIALMNHREKAVVAPAQLAPRTAYELVARAQVAVGMRLHFHIFAVTAGVPLLGLSRSLKTKTLLTRYNAPLLHTDRELVFPEVLPVLQQVLDPVWQATWKVTVADRLREDSADATTLLERLLTFIAVSCADESR